MRVVDHHLRQLRQDFLKILLIRRERCQHTNRRVLKPPFLVGEEVEQAIQMGSRTGLAVVSVISGAVCRLRVRVPGASWSAWLAVVDSMSA